MGIAGAVLLGMAGVAKASEAALRSAPRCSASPASGTSCIDVRDGTVLATRTITRYREATQYSIDLQLASGQLETVFAAADDVQYRTLAAGTPVTVEIWSGDAIAVTNLRGGRVLTTADPGTTAADRFMTGMGFVWFLATAPLLVARNRSLWNWPRAGTDLSDPGLRETAHFTSRPARRVRMLFWPLVGAAGASVVHVLFGMTILPWSILAVAFSLLFLAEAWRNRRGPQQLTLTEDGVEHQLGSGLVVRAGWSDVDLLDATASGPVVRLTRADVFESAASQAVVRTSNVFSRSQPTFRMSRRDYDPRRTVILSPFLRNGGAGRALLARIAAFVSAVHAGDQPVRNNSRFFDRVRRRRDAGPP
jgi:hypothetical protein